jgi:uncharacterized membrane protein
MTVALLAKLVHVLVGFGLVAGLIGRSIVLHRARHTEDVQLIAELSRLAGTFDRRLVIPGSQLVLVFGVAAAWLQGWPILGFIVGGDSNWVLASLALFLAITALVPTVFLPTGRAFDAALEAAVAHGNMSDELRAALDDRRVRRAHQFEAMAIFTIVILMVVKPF